MSSLKILTAETMISTAAGTGMARAWFPTIVAEAFLESTKDGKISLSPDPVTFIEGDLTWYNDTGCAVDMWVVVTSAPRTVVAQNPSCVVIHNAWSFRVGASPSADFPSVMQDEFGARLAIDRPSVAAADVQFGRVFLDGDGGMRYVHVGVVDDEESLHFRYLAAAQTPGAWVTSPDFEPRWEAHARWARIQALASPMLVVPEGTVVVPPPVSETGVLPARLPMMLGGG